MTIAECPLEHVAVFHDGADDLAARLVPDVRAGLAGGDAVLVCLEPDTARVMAGALGDDADRVTFIDAGDRYASPAKAMHMLHTFATASLASGAKTVWSIGSIGFDGSDADRRWLRYEAAVNEVLGHLPLKALCSYDVGRLPAAVVDAARHTHAVVDGPDGKGASPDFGRTSYVALPASDAALSTPPPSASPLAVGSAGTARKMMSDLYRDVVPAPLLGDLHLVVSEMVTNALRHGAPPVALRSWTAGPALRIEVTDHGGGIGDPFAELRPPTGGIGGYGMWLIGQLASDVAIVRRDDTTVVSASFLLDG